jgi:uncharacterized SAM-binding protein YcdF (DUF218 family)
VELRAILTLLALPPLGQFLGLLLGVAIWPWRKMLAVMIWVLSLGSLLFLSMPAVSTLLYQQLESEPRISAEQLQDLAGKPDVVIVVLGGGRHGAAPEFSEHEVVTREALMRLHYAAYLQQQTGLPMLVSGGDVYGDAEYSEAELMASALRVWGFAPRWLEKMSRTTAENAHYSARMLQAEGVTSVILITEAGHMPRSVYSFEREGLQVFPAPVYFLGSPCRSFCFWPNALALQRSAYALKEFLGMAWYRLERWFV